MAITSLVQHNMHWLSATHNMLNPCRSELEEAAVLHVAEPGLLVIGICRVELYVETLHQQQTSSIRSSWLSLSVYLAGSGGMTCRQAGNHSIMVLRPASRSRPARLI